MIESLISEQPTDFKYSFPISNIENNYNNCTIDLLTIGKKGHGILSKQFNVIENNNEIFDDLTYENVAEIAEKLMSLYVDGS